MRPRAQTELFGNPILIGAVTVLVAAVGLLLAYNANNGLPFVPTYDITARVPDAAELTAGNEVRIGGKRVGTIVGIDARQARDGTPAAILQLKLDRYIQELPVDTRATVRPRSTLGLKYLELQPGRARRGIPPGGELPLRQANAIVELDEVINTFDAPTRQGLAQVLTELGGGLAGRGADVNRTLEGAPAFLAALEPVARTLRLARTDLRGLVAGLSSAAGAVAPVSARLGSLVDGAAITLAAISSTGGALGETIDEAPATEAVATRAARRARPVLADGAALLRDLRPAAAILPRAARNVAGAVEAGTPVLHRAIALGDRLGDTLAALDALFRDPATDGAVRKLTNVVVSLQPTLRHLIPFQVRCNYLGVWTRNASSAISEGDANGTWFRFFPVVALDEMLQPPDPAPELHVNPYPDTGQGGECEAGNEVWLPGRRIGPAPGRQPGTTQSTSPGTVTP
jgi:virulence factor Mce-like protein